MDNVPYTICIKYRGSNIGVGGGHYVDLEHAREVVSTRWGCTRWYKSCDGKFWSAAAGPNPDNVETVYLDPSLFHQAS